MNILIKSTQPEGQDDQANISHLIGPVFEVMTNRPIYKPGQVWIQEPCGLFNLFNKGEYEVVYSPCSKLSGPARRRHAYLVKAHLLAFNRSCIPQRHPDRDRLYAIFHRLEEALREFNMRYAKDWPMFLHHRGFHTSFAAKVIKHDHENS